MSNQDPDEDDRKPDSKQTWQALSGAWIAIGAGAGVAIGVALDNIALGLAIGAAVGVVLMAITMAAGRK